MKNAGAEVKALYKKDIKAIIKKLEKACKHLEKYINDTDKMIAGFDKFEVKEVPAKLAKLKA